VLLGLVQLSFEGTSNQDGGKCPPAVKGNIAKAVVNLVH